MPARRKFCRRLIWRNEAQTAAGQIGRMEHLQHLGALGLFDARVPRYTSYPTAAVFSSGTGAAFQASALAGLDPQAPVSVYIHIPFCERLCWFCACHTQGTQTLAPVESYIDTLEAELALLRETLPLRTGTSIKLPFPRGVASPLAAKG